MFRKWYTTWFLGEIFQFVCLFFEYSCLNSWHKWCSILYYFTFLFIYFRNSLFSQYHWHDFIPPKQQHQQVVDNDSMSYSDCLEYSNRTYRFYDQTNPNLDCTCRTALCCSEGNRSRRLKITHPKTHPNLILCPWLCRKPLRFKEHPKEIIKYRLIYWLKCSMKEINYFIKTCPHLECILRW